MKQQAKQGGLRVIQGTKDAVDGKKRELGKKAIRLGYQWSNGQVGLKGERELINSIKALMPGLGESVVRVAGPAILEALGIKVSEGEGDNECAILLAHLLLDLRPVTKRAAISKEPDLDLSLLKTELGQISKSWGMSVDPDGHYIDITATPQMPTGMGFGGENAEPQYDEVNVAVIFLEEPKTELELNANFICLAPARIAKLIAMLEDKE